MQKNYLKALNISMSVFVSAILLLLLRITTLIFGFDFETSFFANNTVAYILYALFIVGIIAPVIAYRRTIVKEYTLARQTLFKEILLGLLAAVFLTLFVLLLINQFTDSLKAYTLLELISHYICLIFSLLAAVYFIFRLFTPKVKSTVMALLSTAPAIFLGSMLIKKFAAVAASAASLSHFPDMISLLVLAFFMLNEGKGFIPGFRTNPAKSFAMLLSVSVALSFSAFPDLFSIIALGNTLGVEATVFLILKLVFTVYSVSEILYFLKTVKECDK